jgi:DNA primase
MTLEEMIGTLADLGIEVTSSRGDEIQALCPAHEERTGKQDRNPSWWINADTGAHNCFSCGWKGSLYSLISYVTGTDYEKAGEFLGSVNSLSARFERLTKEKKVKVEEPTYITESMLSAFTEPPDYALKARGLSPEAAIRYSLKWDERNRNWITPIREPITGKLLGWQEKGFDHRYFNNKPAGIKKATTLFGYKELKDNWAVIVESPLDVVRLASLNIPGLATYGAVVSDTQFNLIRGLDKIIFAMDNDQAGKAASLSMLHKCQDLSVEAWFFDYDKSDIKDVGGMSLDEVAYGIQNAKHMARNEGILK